MEALFDGALPEAVRLFDAIAGSVSDIVITPRARFMAAYLSERMGDSRRALAELPGLASELPLLGDLARLRAASAALALGDCPTAADLASQVDRASAFAPEAARIEAKARHPESGSGEAEAMGEPPANTSREKRAILASWASDACAIEAAPAWRRVPDGRHAVPVDDILEALRTLDALAAAPHAAWARRQMRRRSLDAVRARRHRPDGARLQ